MALVVFVLSPGSAGVAPGRAVAQVYYNNPYQTSPNSDQTGNAPSASATGAGTAPATATTGQATSSPFTGQAASTYAPQEIQSQSTAPGATQDASGSAPNGSPTAAGAAGAGVRLPVVPLQPLPLKPPAEPGEFEKFVAKTLGRPLPRFGASLVTGEGRDFSPPATTTVPPDYALNPGDELLVHLTGSVEGQLQLTINSDGRIFLPRVGAVDVAGVRYGDVQALLAKRVGEQYRDFKLSVAIGHLHGIRVYVTGYAASPGAYTLSSLSTLVNAVMAAGGPSAGGSFRSIELRRNGQVVTDFDLYDLLLRGDKTRDASLQNEDVIYIAPVGPQMAITGSVNVEAVYEGKSGETLGDLLSDAGGLSTLADPSKVYVSRLSNLDRMGWEQLNLAQAGASPIQRGDILRVTSVADYDRPLERQAIVVKIEGEVDRPGRYYMPPNSTIADLMAQAGGVTQRAFLFGSELDRVTVQQQQQAGFDQALRDLELSIAASPLSFSGIDAAAAGSQVGRAQLARQIIEQMRARKPDGRLVLSLTPQATALPGDLTLENDDRIYIPPRPTTVGVFGAIYQQGSFLYRPGQTLGDYVKLAGGPEKIAEKGDVFVVRANGAVLSKRERHWGSSFENEPALPGDVIFVPIKTTPSLWWDRFVQATQVLYNFGLGAAAIKVLTQ
jgi:polysaccharide export outer membrane protein